MVHSVAVEAADQAEQSPKEEVGDPGRRRWLLTADVLVLAQHLVLLYSSAHLEAGELGQRTSRV